MSKAQHLEFGREIGRNIKKFRLRNNLTQEQLAEKVECLPDKISQYELGKLQPDMIFVRMIADCLGVSLDDLLPTKGGPDDVNRQAS